MPLAIHDEAKKIPFLDLPNMNGRVLGVRQFYDHGKWRRWKDAGDGKLEEIGAVPAEDVYLSNCGPACTSDFDLDFLDFVIQRVCFKSVSKASLAIRDDMFNMFACLAKVQLLHETKNHAGEGVHRMVATEVEYLFMVARSMFDFLQEIARCVWDECQPTKEGLPKKRQLKKSFFDMVSKGGKALSIREICETYGVPQRLARFYAQWQPFFFEIRGFRDNLVHHGSPIQTIVFGDVGFLVHKALKPFDGWDVWPPDRRSSDGQWVLLIDGMTAVVSRTLSACEHFATTMSAVADFPPPVAPGMRVYLRSDFGELVGKLMNGLHGQPGMAFEKRSASGELDVTSSFR